MAGGPRYTESQARAAIIASGSWSEALRLLDMCPTGNNHKVLKRYAEAWGISADHFDPYAANAARMLAQAVPLREVLVRGSTYHRKHLKRRLYAEGLKARACELCGQSESWNGLRMALILDHINGHRNDNRLENLRILCPNCAATLDTHCGRKNRRLPPERACKRCGGLFRPNYATQRYCSRACGSRYPRPPAVPRPNIRKVERPPYEQLVREIADTSWLAVGRKYGVSDNAIRKWIRQYERGLADASNGEEPRSA